jgi:hypothetical protein
MGKYREEVINVQFAELLVEYGLEANPETIQSHGRPDVLINMGGLKVVVEGKFRDMETLTSNVTERIKKGIADISMGVLYPDEIKEVHSLQDLKEKMRDVTYEVIICSFRTKGLQTDKYPGLSLDNVAATINNLFRLHVRNDVVREQVKNVEGYMRSLVDSASDKGLFFKSETVVARLKDTLGIKRKSIGSRKAKKGVVEKDILRIALFVLFDSMVFHEAIASTWPSISSLRRPHGNYQRFLEKEWKKILDIDYQPVFGLAGDLLADFPSSPETENLLKTLMELSIDCVTSGILLKHDFMGRIYHTQLLRTTGGYYATYYTSIPAAWLLANLVFRGHASVWDFSDIDKLKEFKVIDPACGSGTLLSASYMAIRDEYLLSRPKNLDLDKFHRVMVENVLHGWDILDYATHLTLTTLALHNYESTFSCSNIYTLPIGSQIPGKVHLGSLDFLSSQRYITGRGFSQPAVRKGIERPRAEAISLPSCDVVIMNPPYSRSANPKTRFAYSEEEVKKLMDKEMKKLTSTLHMSGIGQAGLGPYFILLGDKLLKTSGVMALVLPRAALSGVAWERIRERFAEHFHVQYIVSNHDPGDKDTGTEPWNWSENTDLAEVLVVARKSKNDDKKKEEVTYVNLWNKPRNEVESLMICQQISKMQGNLARTLREGKYVTLKVGDREVGCIYRVRQDELQGNWLSPCLFANPELNRFLIETASLLQHFVVPLSEICTHMGMDCGTISRKLELTELLGPIKVIWGYNLKMNRIDASSLVQFARYTNGPVDLRKGNLLIPYTLYLQGHSNTAFYCSEQVVSNAFWTVSVEDKTYAKLIAMWMNSTFGFLTLLCHGIASRGYHFEFKHGNLKKMFVITRESGIGEEKTESMFTAIKNSRFFSFAKEFHAASNGKGLRKEIDDFFITELGLSINLKSYYEMLSKEPILSLQRM